MSHVTVRHQHDRTTECCCAVVINICMFWKASRAEAAQSMHEPINVRQFCAAPSMLVLCKFGTTGNGICFEALQKPQAITAELIYR